MLRQPGAAALPASPGEAISRFRDDAQAVGIGLTWLLDPIGQVVVAWFALSVLLSIDATLTVTVLVPVIGVIVVARLSDTRIRRYRRAAQQSIGDVTGLLGEAFGSALAVKVAGAEERIVDHLRATQRGAPSRDAGRSGLHRGRSARRPSTSPTSARVSCCCSAARAVYEGSFSVGEFALFVSYIGWLTAVAGMFGTFMAHYRQMEVSLDRLGTLMRGAPPVGSGQPAPPIYMWGRAAAAAAAKVGGRRALRELRADDLTLPLPGHHARHQRREPAALKRGTFTVVTGRIGAGKTTLLRVLLGLLPLQGGELYWNDRRVADPADLVRAAARRLHAASAAPRAASRCATTSCSGCPERAADLERAMHAAVLERDVPELEAGLDTLVGPRGVKLSGGQVQRVAAARMFARPAELLVVDDLSSALDVETERLLWERLFERPDLTCLAVSHRHAALQPRRSHHRPWRRPDPRSGHAGRPARTQRRDAPALDRARS